MRHSSDGCAPQYTYSDPSFTTTKRTSVYLDDEVLRLKDTIKERDTEIVKLKSEIHKLKVKSLTPESFTEYYIFIHSLLSICVQSVLQQTTTRNTNQSKDINGSFCTSDMGTQDRNCNHISNLTSKHHKISQCDGNLTIPSATKRQGVSGESTDTAGQLSRDIRIPKYDKDFR